MGAFSHRRRALLCSAPLLLALAICLFLLWRAHLARSEQASATQSRLAWLEGQITDVTELLAEDPCVAKARLESWHAEEPENGERGHPAGSLGGKNP